MNLPCRHIFKLLTNQDLELFVPTVCAYRWTKQAHHKYHPALTAGGAVNPPRPVSMQTIKVPDEINKYKKAAAVTKEINNLASTMNSSKYKYYMEQLAVLKNQMLNPDVEPEDQNDLESSNTETPNMGCTASNPLRTYSGNVRASDTIATVTNNDNEAASSNPLALQTNNDNEAGPSNQLILQSSRNNIGLIKLPQKVTSLGRPKGKVNTVAGTKRKAKSDHKATPAKKKFLNLTIENQSLTIVRWLTNKTATQILYKKTARHEIIEDATIFNRLRNDTITFRGTKKYFEPKAFKYLRNEIAKLVTKTWHCVKCSRKLSGDQIMCHSCLDWFHVKCTQYSTPKGNNDFFCNDCKKNCNVINL